MHPTDHIQIVTFGLDGLTHEDYAAHCRSVAPQFAAIPGLRAKAWLSDPASGTYGGVYAWVGRAAMEDYLQGPQLAALRANPHITGLATREFAVLPAPTRITQRREALPLAPRDAWAA
jgi:hypothetical protein